MLGVANEDNLPFEVGSESIPRGVKRKRRFDIGAYQHAKKIAIQNAQAEQSRAVEALRNCLVGKEGELEELTKMVNASTRKIDRKKRKPT